jgi:hypothetical protein
MDALEEIRALRARLADLEARATKQEERPITTDEQRRNRKLEDAQRQTRYEQTIADEYRVQERRRQERNERRPG